ncbi:MAG: nucleotidyl transferase AbiEii/AbiGii toxin family protein [Candidatus Cloacimonadales bacterium]|nr:nucleotidyl transferase AbiEii/AbiGii toxin family protein [Candidatus Cloacimonadales bacterium]
MIDQSIFNEEWFKELKSRYKFQNAAVAEKMVHALSLVEELSKTDLDFVLKGGTSLILLISPTRRFSVDVDIITKASRESIESFLNEICTSSEHFTRFELDERRSYNPGIPKAHYFMFYKSVNSGREDYVLIDILFEDVLYPSVIKKQIGSQWVKTIEPEIDVKVPSIESVLGDKLTAFAPNTTGVPYGKDKELEIAKQLFDIGSLFDYTRNLDDLSRSFFDIVAAEIEYRKLSIDSDEVLHDVIATAKLIASQGKLEFKEDQEHYREILTGIKALNEFLINERFRLEDAVLASAKAALLAAKLLRKDNSSLQLFSPELNILDYMIEDPDHNSLNKLRKIPGGSLFYWYHTIKLIKE